MNILLYTLFAVSPTYGGVERICSSLVGGLENYENIHMYSVYNIEIPVTFGRTKFNEALHYRVDFDNKIKISKFIKTHNIDICICMGPIRFLQEAISCLQDTKIICRHTTSPGQESNIFIFEPSIWLKHPLKSIKNFYQEKCYSRWLRNVYRNVYEKTDLLVLMSPNQKKGFMDFGRLIDDAKIRIIPNMLSYDTFFDMSDYYKKQKEVLIVGRLNEVDKKISLALRIWKSIEKISNLQDWHLTIVGYGQDEKRYKEYVNSHNLKRVFFEGMQEPNKYYKRASIFMMTSKNEAWGNVLTEAQMNGCVPLAFDSLVALPVIISDGINGFSIPKNNTTIYQKKLVQLMTDDALRKEMSTNAVESSHRFDRAVICREWYKLLESLKEETGTGTTVR